MNNWSTTEDLALKWMYVEMELFLVRVRESIDVVREEEGGREGEGEREKESE